MKAEFQQEKGLHFGQRFGDANLKSAHATLILTILQRNVR